METAIERELAEQVTQTSRSSCKADDAREIYLSDAKQTKVKLKHLLREEHERVSKSAKVVFAFYVTGDILLPDSLRCIDAPGAAFPAAASHFLSGKEEILLREESPQFFEDASFDPLRDGNSAMVERLVSDDPRRNRVFGDFVTRESVVSRGRFTFRPDQRLGAVFTVNFRRRVARAEWHEVKPKYQRVFDRLIAAYPWLPETHRENCCDYLPRLLALRKIVHGLRLKEHSGNVCRYHDYLKLIIENVVAGCAVRGGAECFGSIWFKGPDSHLNVAARTSGPEVTERHDLDVARGEGVISWVALRKRAIRIDDLLDRQNAAFRRIHVSDSIPIRSQLAVPIILGDQLLGVVNLESTAPKVFDADSSGFLCSVADDIAALYLDRWALSSWRDTESKSGRLKAERRDGVRTTRRTLKPARRAGKQEKQVDAVRVPALESATIAMEGRDMEENTETIAAVRRRLKALSRSDRLTYVAGIDLWERIGKTLPVGEIDEWQQRFAAKQAPKAPTHFLQRTLDAIVAAWVVGGDSSATMQNLDDLREQVRERMACDLPLMSEHESLPIIGNSLQAAVRACAQVEKIDERANRSKSNARDSDISR